MYRQYSETYVVTQKIRWWEKHTKGKKEMTTYNSKTHTCFDYDNCKDICVLFADKTSRKPETARFR